MAAKSLTYERLKEVLSYDPETGHFTWLKDMSRCARVGQRAGTRHCAGYIALTIDREPCLAHRLAWLYVHGQWPSGHIDHANGVRNDNRIANLRVATSSQNVRNSRRWVTNTSGYKGVSWHAVKKRWMAQIQINGKSIWLGAFDNPEEAHAAYCIAARRIAGEFANPG